MPRTQADVDFEEQQAKLARFLAGTGDKPLDLYTNEEHSAIWRRARVMLKAEKLLDACEFALTTLSGLSSEEFSAGGDRIARDRLVQAITEANEYGFDSQRRLRECREAVRSSIQINNATTL
jgi:hypothetical protein